MVRLLRNYIMNKKYFIATTEPVFGKGTLNMDNLYLERYWELLVDKMLNELIIFEPITWCLVILVAIVGIVIVNTFGLLTALVCLLLWNIILLMYMQFAIRKPAEKRIFEYVLDLDEHGFFERDKEAEHGPVGVVGTPDYGESAIMFINKKREAEGDLELK